MQSLLDNDVDAPSNDQQYPVTDLVRTYLQRSGSKFFGLASARREHADLSTAESRAQDLWDYLGDFA